MPQFDYACDLDDDIGDDDVNDFGDDGDDGDDGDVNDVNDVGDDGGGFLLAACWPTSQPARPPQGMPQNSLLWIWDFATPDISPRDEDFLFSWLFGPNSPEVYFQTFF